MALVWVEDIIALQRKKKVYCTNCMLNSKLGTFKLNELIFTYEVANAYEDLWLFCDKCKEQIIC